MQSSTNSVGSLSNPKREGLMIGRGADLDSYERLQSIRHVNIVCQSGVRRL